MAINSESLNPIWWLVFPCFHVQFTESLVSGWMQSDEEPKNLLAASGWRPENGAVISEAYETTKRAAVRNGSTRHTFHPRRSGVTAVRIQSFRTVYQGSSPAV